MRAKAVLLFSALSILVALVLVTFGRTGNESTSHEVLIAVGDSYAAGYQPNDPSGEASRHGFVDLLAPLLNARHPATVLNFGCGGATTATVLETLGCTTGAQAANGQRYATTQLDAAVQAVTTHRGHIAAIVVALGFNDFAQCAGQPQVARCVRDSAPTITHRLRQILVDLRRAAGAEAQVVGITYPNVGLVGWKSSPPKRQQAQESLDLTKHVAYPALLSAYEGLGAVADVTKASGGLDPLPAPSDAPEPQAISTLCTLTWMCRQGDVHLTPAGQDFVARLIAKRLHANA